MTHSKLYVRTGLQKATLDALDAFLAQRGPNGQTLSNTVKYTFKFDANHSTRDQDKGQWTVIVRVDFASPRSDPDGHGGTPHAQISSCLGQLVKKDDKPPYTNTQNFKDAADTRVLSDEEAVGVIDTGALTPTILTWLAERLLDKAPFANEDLPDGLHFGGVSRKGS